MKVLILANNDVGLYKFRKELIETLLKNNEVFISLPSGDYVDRLVNMGCNYMSTNLERRGTNPLKDIKLLKQYLNILEEYKPDIVLTYTIKPNVYGGLACQIKNIPYVVNVTGLSSAMENGGLLGFITETLYRIGIRKAQKVFFQNEDNQRIMVNKKMVKNNYDLLPGSGVNLNNYKLLDFPKGKNIEFAYVGRLLTQKGIRLYLDAAKQIHNKYPNTLFHICGIDDDGYIDEVNKLQDDGVVLYHGLVDDMNTIYEKIECLVHPSYYAEGMSNVLLEASACGRAVITTNRPGCKEVVDNEVNGYIVEQKSLEDLIDKIEMYLSLSNDQRKQMGLNGRKKIEKEFNRNIVIKKYLDEVNKINGK